MTVQEAAGAVGISRGSFIGTKMMFSGWMPPEDRAGVHQIHAARAVD
ncbi:MAG: hypothetical protein NC548_24880 [Lachnospiraceae bacterium]|nr:hypothetical protein [Lachnospiraceae bacterium]